MKFLGKLKRSYRRATCCWLHETASSKPDLSRTSVGARLFVDFACITGIDLMNRHGGSPRTSDIANDSVCVFVRCAVIVFVARCREGYLRWVIYRWKQSKSRSGKEDLRHVSRAAWDHPSRHRLAEILIATAATRIRDHSTKKGCQGVAGAW